MGNLCVTHVCSLRIVFILFAVLSVSCSVTIDSVWAEGVRQPVNQNRHGRGVASKPKDNAALPAVAKSKPVAKNSRNTSKLKVAQPKTNVIPAKAAPAVILAPVSREDHLLKFKLAPENVGYALVDLENGERLDTLYETMPYIPASVAKVPTTLAAMQILGPSHQFQTQVKMTGSVVDGVLQGNLYLVGGIDPAFSMENLTNLVANLHQQGIARVEGNFYYDESKIIPSPRISTDQNDEETYNQGVSALSLEFNRSQLQWGVSRKTKKLLSISAPNVGLVQLLPLPKDAQGGPKFVYVGGNGQERWQLSSIAPKSGVDWVPIKNPALWAAYVFRDYCHKRGLELPVPQPSLTPSSATLLTEHVSLPLATLVTMTLKASNNLWTEMIASAAAHQLTGKAVSLPETANILSSYLFKQRPQTSWQGFNLLNNSGLSSKSRVTPWQMVDIQRLAYATIIGEGKNFSSLLPYHGFRPAKGRRSANQIDLWAKTGTVHYGKGLSGYFISSRGRKLAFAIFVSDMNKRQNFDAILDHYSARDVQVAKAWNGRAKGFIHSLIEDWYNRF